MIELGQTVGNYRVTAKLGEGGMGVVYLAEHPVIGRKAALKVIHPQHGRNADVVARFVNEASAISRIGHEHIVEVTDFGRTEAGDFYFIMEYLEGEPLSELIARTAPFAPAQALRIARQIADALAASHAHGVIHRDLKPENIFVVSRGDDPAFVKVLDFGLAKLIDDGGPSAHHTRAGVVMGTPFYMSPEQCEGASDIDGRADVYALGVVLFEMLTGRVPFGGDDYADVLMKQISVRAPAARSLVPDLPEELDHVLHRSLSKAPADRFASMADFKEALLEPARHTLPPQAGVSVHEDLTSRLASARPMSRAEIRRSRVATRRKARAFSPVAMAALTSLALSAGLTYASHRRATVTPAPRVPAVVSVSFGSDPEGVTVLDASRTILGTTPLSIQVTRTDVPVEYVFEKPGYETRSMSLAPRETSSVFAAMHAEEPPRPAAPVAAAAERDPSPPPTRRARAEPPGHHDRRPPAPANDTDTDGVLAPSFVTSQRP